MKKIEIFEPAMCCPTGLCGAVVDPELLRISSSFDQLSKTTIQTKRYNLSGSPMEFMNNGSINKLIGEKGIEILPVTLVDGNVVLTQRYPKNEELERMLDLPENFFS